MTVQSSDSPTIIDVKKMKDPKGNLLRGANLMAQVSTLNRTFNYVPCNGGLVHRVGQIVTEPGTTIRARNEGVLATTEQRVQHDEGFADYHQWAKVDAGIAQDIGQIAQFRGQAVRGKFAAIARKVEYDTFYGSKAANAGKGIDGLVVRFNSIGQQCIAQTASGSALTSLWVFRASPETVYYIYPEEGTSGIRHRDFGLVIEDSQNGVAGANMSCYKDEVWQEVGLAVEDPRCVVRIANIPSGDFTALTGTQETTDKDNLIHQIMIANGRLPKDVMGRDFGVCNRTVYTGLRRLAYEKSTAAVSVGTAFTAIGQKEAIIVDGLPIFLSDAIGNGETAVA